MVFRLPSRETSDLDDHPLSRYRYRTLSGAGTDSPSIEVSIPRLGDTPDLIVTTRLVKLHPGLPQDPLVVLEINDQDIEEITPVPTRPPVDLDRLRAALPQGWDAHRTTQGRIIFSNRNTTSWRPPDPKIPRSEYENEPDDVKFEPKYDALSYAWGSSSRTKSVLMMEPRVPGVSPVYYRMSVTESLYEALQNLRHPRESRTIWADAICINQDDDLEKARHVKHMGDIYRLANRVVVWLGSSSPTSSLALATLEHLGNQVEYSLSLDRWFDLPDGEEKGWGAATFVLPYDAATWTAIEELLSRSWFDRLWIVQELQLSSRQPGALIQCGADVVSAAALRRAIVCLYMKTGTLPVALHPLVQRAYDVIRPKTALILHRIVEQVCFNQRCKDPRDKMYGILSMLPTRFATTIQPDYRNTCTAAMVYATSLVNHARHVQRFELWGYALADRAMTDLPTWVPDWSIPTPVRRQLMPELAASTSRCEIRHDPDDPGVLHVLGVRCDTLTKITGPLPKATSHADAVVIVRGWQPDDLDTATYRPTGVSLRRAYADTLLSGEVEERWPGRPLKLPIAEWERQDYEDALFGERASTTPPATITQPVYRALEFCRGRSFFQTATGYYGIAPEGIAPDDVVTVVLGCNKPVVLRPQPDNTFLFMGEAYVPGLQGGVAFLGPLPTPWNLIMLGYGPGGRERHQFANTETGEQGFEDPRLSHADLNGWQRVVREFDGDDPENYDFFRKDDTPEMINYDPRLTGDALERRGVQLEWFTLK